MEPVIIYDSEKLRTFVSWINWELRKVRSTIRFSDNIRNLLEWNLLKNMLEALTGRAVSIPEVYLESPKLSPRRYVRVIMEAYDLNRDQIKIWLKKPWNDYKITHVIIFMLVNMHLKHKYPMQFNHHGHDSVVRGCRIKNTLRVRERILYYHVTNPRSLANSVNSWSQELFSTQEEHKELVNQIKRMDRINHKQLIFIEEGQGIIPELFLYQNFVLNSASYRKSEEFKSLWEFASISTQLEIREDGTLVHEENCLTQLQKLDNHWNILAEREGVKFSYNQMSLCRAELSSALADLAEALPSGKSMSSFLNTCSLSRISKAWEKLSSCLQKAKEKERDWENHIINLILNKSSITSSETSGDGSVHNSDSNTIVPKEAVKQPKQQHQIPPKMFKPESQIRKGIKKNLKSLCKCTTVNEELLTSLIADRIITYELKDKLTESKSEIERALLLYRFCENSVSDEKLPGLLIALRESANTRALQILHEERPSTQNNEYNEA